jgi:hypothetical protein
MAKRAKPNVARRQSYDQIIEVLSPIHFCRMFRMHRCSFDILCECVISKFFNKLHYSRKSGCFPMMLRSHQRTMQPMPWAVLYQEKLKLQLCSASWREQVILMSCLPTVYQLLLYTPCSTKQLPGCHQHFNFLSSNGLL